MPPITSPRRTAVHTVHAPPAIARPVPIPRSPLGMDPVSPVSTVSNMGLGHTPTSSGTSPSSYGSFRPAPYMVALAGWPDPVFVAEARETWEKKHSRPPSPVGFRDVRDGIGGPPVSSMRDLQQNQFRDGVSNHQGGTPPSRLPPLGNQVRDGVSMDGVYASRGMARSGSGMDSSMRSRGSSPPGRSSMSPDAPSPPASHSRQYSHSHSHSYSSTHSHNSHSGNNSPPGTSSGTSAAAAAAALRSRRVHGFPDPRYHPNAGIITARRAGLRVAPAWTSASTSAGRSSHTPGEYHGHHTHAHAHGPAPYPPGRGGAAGSTAHSAGVRRVVVPPHYIQRSVPEMWPPPAAKAAVPHAQLGLATAVYPRDPDRSWMLARGTASASAGTGSRHSTNGSGSVSPAARMSPHPASDKERREYAERNAKDTVKAEQQEREREHEREDAHGVSSSGAVARNGNGGARASADAEDSAVGKPDGDAKNGHDDRMDVDDH